ncbi:dsRNA-binding domain-like protein [Tilletiaria anomala UBC 951]|uniref:DsRNA-binding domain-like protein n=1 Tax=Tilletiaria anomala (strain ATCC 24038 / CBS 436.72 / UBC 951) TaxID=1037660 RepID=A0A066VT33_TILAU|nr:dsRNA-binding domain-like protein [Tilletiaria anomala UBC 951]KDN41969.1 dsRNA-binding domain-like protein [Tilletiaria anomala UBC 951]
MDTFVGDGSEHSFLGATGPYMSTASGGPFCNGHGFSAAGCSKQASSAFVPASQVMGAGPIVAYPGWQGANTGIAGGQNTILDQGSSLAAIIEIQQSHLNSLRQKEREQREEEGKKLKQSLGPELIATRKGPGGMTLSYLSTHAAISIANSTFGWENWSSFIISLVPRIIPDETRNGTRYTVLTTCITRVTHRSGVSHEDVGHGCSKNQSDLATALEIADKTAASDSLKRALRQLGERLGLCLYDQGFLAEVRKLKNVLTQQIYTAERSWRWSFASKLRPPTVRPSLNLSNGHFNERRRLCCPIKIFKMKQCLLRRAMLTRALKCVRLKSGTEAVVAMVQSATAPKPEHRIVTEPQSVFWRRRR